MAIGNLCQRPSVEIRLKGLTVDGRLPFVFEASGSETHFTNGYDPDPRARRLFAFQRPGALARTVRDAEADAVRATWRGKVRDLPDLLTEELRPAQVKAIEGIERSLAEPRFSRSLVQMATGAGKTFTAVTKTYRLLKFREFQNYATPDDGRRFTELYNVDKLTSAGMAHRASVGLRWAQRGLPGPDRQPPNFEAGVAPSFARTQRSQPLQQ